MDASEFLAARGLGRRTPDGARWLLRDIDFTLQPGECVAIVGPSGAGKTLLLRALALLDPTDAGAVLWHGRPPAPHEVPAFRAQVIYLHQRPALFEGTVEDNLRLPFSLALHRDRHFDRERIIAWLIELGRDASFLDKTQRDLSGGESQITALLRALQLDPSALLLDESTSGLDPDTVRRAEGLLLGWLADRRADRALLWVSHAPAQTQRVAGRILTLEAGRLERGAVP
jgi:putative ABC transport system ATP-binding protein